MSASLAVTYSSFGEPSEVLSLTERPLAAPAADQALVKMLAATINPSDFGTVLGTYGRLPELPAVVGREGVGEVIEIGSGVTSLAVGDRVQIPNDAGSWQSRFLWQADDLDRIPEGIPLDFAAMSRVNPPTAWRLLRDAYISPGEWVVQNGANSSVGLFVIEMARHLGLKTLNVVRRPELVKPLEQLGGDIVVTEDSGFEKQVAELTGGGQVPLALNSIGGDSALRLLKCLSRGGRHVTFGAMTFEPVRFPTRQLIFNGNSMTGFWMDHWYRENGKTRIQAMFDNLYGLARDGVVTPPVAGRFPLSQYREAIAAARQPKLGKILLLADDA